MQPTRRAKVYGKPWGNSSLWDSVDNYLYSNFKLVGGGVDQDGRDFVVFEGADNAGFTMDAQMARLASGMLFATEITETEKVSE